MEQLTALQRDMMFAITSLESPNGREIQRELEETQDRSFVSGHVYTVFEELESAGLLEKSRRNGRSNEYALTEAGRSWVQNRYRWEQSYVEIAPLGADSDTQPGRW